MTTNSPSNTRFYKYYRSQLNNLPPLFFLQPLNSANLLVESVKALALCHNVTPVEEEEGGASNGAPSHLQSSEEEEEEEEVLFENEESCRGKRMISYQASSPDEVRERGKEV